MVLGRFGPISFRASGHPADLRICGPFGWNTIGYCTSGLRAEPFTISKGDLIVSVFSRLVLGSLVALLFTGLAVAEDPKPKELTGDAKTVQGRWVSKDESGESTWVFEGDKLKLDTPTRKYRMVCKLDTETKPHKSIDLDVQPDSPNAAGTLGKCIYKLDGDKLTICFGGEKRPEEFKNDFPTSFIFELTRSK